MCDIKFASVCGNKGIFPLKSLCGEPEIKLPEDVPESLREKLCPLLDEGGGGWCLIGVEIEVFQQFMADAAALHAEAETDELYKPQFAFARKILSGIFDKRCKIAGHGVHDRPEGGLDFLCKRHMHTSLKLD